MSRIATVTILAFSLIAGCSKKTKETVPDTSPPPVTQTPPRSQPTGGNASVAPSGGGAVGGSPSSTLSGSGGGGGVMSGYKAGRRLKAQAELDQLALTIEQLRDPFGKMPTKEQILAEVKKSLPSVFIGIEEGAYILTGTMDGGGLWAYEVDGDKKDGLAVIGGRATRSTTEEVKRYLGLK